LLLILCFGASCHNSTDGDPAGWDPAQPNVQPSLDRSRDLEALNDAAGHQNDNNAIRVLALRRLIALPLLLGRSEPLALTTADDPPQVKDLVIRASVAKLVRQLSKHRANIDYQVATRMYLAVAGGLAGRPYNALLASLLLQQVTQDISPEGLLVISEYAPKLLQDMSNQTILKLLEGLSTSPSQAIVGAFIRNVLEKKIWTARIRSKLLRLQHETKGDLALGSLSKDQVNQQLDTLLRKRQCVRDKAALNTISTALWNHRQAAATTTLLKLHRVRQYGERCLNDSVARNNRGQKDVDADRTAEVDRYELAYRLLTLLPMQTKEAKRFATSIQSHLKLETSTISSIRVQNMLQCRAAQVLDLHGQTIRQSQHCISQPSHQQRQDYGHHMVISTIGQSNLADSVKLAYLRPYLSLNHISSTVTEAIDQVSTLRQIDTRPSVARLINDPRDSVVSSSVNALDSVPNEKIHIQTLLSRLYRVNGQTHPITACRLISRIRSSSPGLLSAWIEREGCIGDIVYNCLPPATKSPVQCTTSPLASFSGQANPPLALRLEHANQHSVIAFDPLSTTRSSTIATHVWQDRLLNKARVREPIWKNQRTLELDTEHSDLSWLPTSSMNKLVVNRGDILVNTAYYRTGGMLLNIATTAMASPIDSIVVGRVVEGLDELLMLEPGDLITSALPALRP